MNGHPASERSTWVPITTSFPDRRQDFARHYGAHPYFTRRSANVVSQYIQHYSRPGDVVLDPFGGSGVTAIEAWLLGRKAIHNDLNPLANFITRTLADASGETVLPLLDGFARVAADCRSKIEVIEKTEEKQVRQFADTLPLPKNIVLPRNSDAECFYDLFSPRQLAGLALLKQAIDRQESGFVRDHLLLAWSASLAKLNKTFLSAKGRAASRGGSSIFSIYRHKIAKQAVELPIWETFEGRFINVVKAKEEIFKTLHLCGCKTGGANQQPPGTIQVLQHDAVDLGQHIPRASVDYVFTDPPYGGFIAYLDLSTIWNHWLGFHVDAHVKAREAIVGGDMALSEEHYLDRLKRSLHTSLELLKRGRWLSVVFQHWNVRYFEAILETMQENNADLRAAVTQDRDVIWSMHKKKSSETVLSGEFILTFYKGVKTTKRSRPVAKKVDDGADKILDEVLRTTESANGSVSASWLLNKVILLAWERRALGALAIDRYDFAARLRTKGWDYDPDRHVWTRNGGGIRMLL